jgi:hypothetical protein
MPSFIYHPHPHIEQHKRLKPAVTADEHVGLNGKVALGLTTAVGTMWCAYAFAVLAIIVLPDAIRGGTLTTVQWISQTFIQLVMLSVIMVGQNILGRASDKRAIDTYKDAEAVLHEAMEIQRHLLAQDEELTRIKQHLGVVEATP